MFGVNGDENEGSEERRCSLTGELAWLPSCSALHEHSIAFWVVL
jgi:hypothetical protein